MRRGLASFDELRARLVDVREGRDSRLEGDYPAEVQPLVSDLNSLLSDREMRVTRALTKAGDLAHGLKTPLAVLNQEAERARAAGQAELAAAITRQVDRMRRQVDYHLAQARASASGGNPGVRCHVLTSADGLARTMHTLHAERGVKVDVDVSHEHFVQGQREDLDEMLGNLVDNACKWARARVDDHLGARGRPRRHRLWTMTARGWTRRCAKTVLRRGVRADEAAPGSGLGLAIVARPRGAVRRLDLPARVARGRRPRPPAAAARVTRPLPSVCRWELTSGWPRIDTPIVERWEQATPPISFLAPWTC